MKMTKRVKCESCGGKGMIIPKKHGGMVVPRKCEHCNGTGTTEAPITNADRIRAMSDEELAKEFADCAIGLYCDTRKKGLPELPESVKQEVLDSLLKWLKQPAKGE